MDVKLRSLICMGLNEQVLHLWLEVLGSSIDTIQKWLVSWQGNHQAIASTVYFLPVQVLPRKLPSKSRLGAGEVRFKIAVAVPFHT